MSETTGWPTVDDFGVVIDWEPVASARMAFTATCGAEPSVQFAKPLTVSNPKWDEATKTYTGTVVTPANCAVAGVACSLFLSFHNTSGGCTYISLMQTGAIPIPPSADPSKDPTRFSDEYLAAVKNFAHLRMMDWGQTNANPIARWSERTPVGWPSYRCIISLSSLRARWFLRACALSPPPPAPPLAVSTRGDPGSLLGGYGAVGRVLMPVDDVTGLRHRYGRTVPSRGMATTATASATGAPYEVMIDLCNAAHADCWLNIPALVDEDFIRNLALLAKERLAPDLNLYLEYVSSFF